jgi:hypothetical protein
MDNYNKEQTPLNRQKFCVLYQEDFCKEQEHYEKEDKTGTAIQQSSLNRVF